VAAATVAVFLEAVVGETTTCCPSCFCRAASEQPLTALEASCLYFCCLEDSAEAEAEEEDSLAAAITTTDDAADDDKRADMAAHMQLPTMQQHPQLPPPCLLIDLVSKKRACRQAGLLWFWIVANVCQLAVIGLFKDAARPSAHIWSTMPMTSSSSASAMRPRLWPGHGR